MFTASSGLGDGLTLCPSGDTVLAPVGAVPRAWAVRPASIPSQRELTSPPQAALAGRGTPGAGLFKPRRNSTVKMMPEPAPRSPGNSLLSGSVEASSLPVLLPPGASRKFSWGILAPISGRKHLSPPPPRAVPLATGRKWRKGTLYEEHTTWVSVNLPQMLTFTCGELSVGRVGTPDPSFGDLEGTLTPCIR